MLLFFRERMQVAHQALEALLNHVCVNLRGGNIGMAEQSLHDTQIRAVMQKMTCKGVTQDVRTDDARRQTGGG